MRTDITKLTAIVRFVITAFILLITMGTFIVLFVFEMPKENKEVIVFAAGIILGNGWPQVIKWWFPSDISSERKTELLAQADSIKQDSGNQPS